MKPALKVFARQSALASAVAVSVMALPLAVQALVEPTEALPSTLDVRGVHGVPTGLALRAPDAAQLKAIRALRAKIGGAVLSVQYNGLTATPRHMFTAGGYLTTPSSDAPELIARRFLRDNRGVFRFSDADLDGLRLRTRSTLPDLGTTIMVFEQQINGLPVYQGDVLVNVSKSGQVVSIGNDNFPQLKVTNSRVISAAEAITRAAAAIGVGGYTPAAIGLKPLLTTYGELEPETIQAESFAADRHFGDEIQAVPVVFPLGDTGRIAWKFNLTDNAHQGVMWQNVVDAQTGAVLRRASLTAFQKGGGVGVGRKAGFRPDVQDLVESQNLAGTAMGKVFDPSPGQLSGLRGSGRATRTGDTPQTYIYRQPIYVAEDVTVANSGRGFKYSQITGRNEYGLPFANNPVATAETFNHAALPGKLGQVLRGFPDARNPSKASPFGWFYLPTDDGGGEVVAGNSNRGATRQYGYTMTGEARTRNAVFGSNAPTANGDQPFSSTSTPLAGPVTLADGRTLSSVIESNYTEGNNVLAADDRNSDNESTHGIRGYSANRQFTSPIFDYTAGYEFGTTDAAAGSFPPSTDPDVPPAAVTLFYLNNLIHDYLYEIGFTEPLWNFQLDNFGKGGAGADSLSAQVMDGSGVNNANMGTGADGSGPRMQMFLFTEGTFRRSDGDFDGDVVAHEFYHGVSNRSASKGAGGCLGVTLVGESGGQGEGWSDFFGASISDDDAVGEFATGSLDVAIRRLPYNNYRWSYGAIRGGDRPRRDQTLPPDVAAGAIPFAVHGVGEVFSATLWDMRELLIMKNAAGVFFDGNRRLGSGTPFFIGDRRVVSVDTQHPINYRASFGSTNGSAPTIGASHFVRPGLLADEIAARGNRTGPLATAVSSAGRLADTLVLRGLQLGVCHPSIVDSRDSILMADQELTGGENRAVIWRAFTSHGMGANAVSTSSGDDPGSQSAPTVVEDFTVPVGVTQCESMGPLPAPSFALTNVTANTVTVAVNGGLPVTGANRLLISRGSSAAGPFALVGNIPATQTTFMDNDAGSGLVRGNTYHYQVRASRDAANNCVSQFPAGAAQSIVVNLGNAVVPNPVFAGLSAVDNPKRCERVALNWKPATSGNPTANLVYDIFRVSTTAAGDGTTEPTFTPSPANRVQQGVTGQSFVDTGLTRNQMYYYLVQARDAANNRIDTANTGNRVVKVTAPTSRAFKAGPPFGAEGFDAASANNRFTPPLRDSATRDTALPVWQRVPNVDFGGGVSSSAMYAPNLDPGSDGAPSDIFTVIGPIAITRDSLLEFDSAISSEAAFDGGVVELAFTPAFNATPFPDNTTTFDLGDYMIQGGYNGKLDGTLAAGVILSPLQGRRAFTGSRGLTHTTIPLSAFAAGGAHASPTGQVFIRFRMTSDAATGAGAGAGWLVDNLVINNLDVCPVNLAPVAALTVTPESGAAPLMVALSGAGSTDPDALSNGDRIVSYTFDFGDGSTPVTQPSSEITHSYTRAGVYTAKLKVADSGGLSSAEVSKTVTVSGQGSTTPVVPPVAPSPPGTIAPAPAAPVSGGEGRFGGGAFGGVWLLLLVALRRMRRVQ